MLSNNQKLNNYAFIDGNNLIQGIKKLGWKLDIRKFRIYLKEKYNMVTAYYFIGFVALNQGLYNSLQKAGFVLIFKPTIPDRDGNVKGNCDAELVLQAMVDINNYDKAMIVSSDGDFACLVRHLESEDKLLRVLCPNMDECSSLLLKAAKGNVVSIGDLRAKLEYIKKNPLRTKP